MPHDENRPSSASSGAGRSESAFFHSEEERLERVLEAIRQAEYAAAAIERARHDHPDLASRIAGEVAFEQRLRRSAPPLAPERIGHYHIRGELAHGGMGRIYKGWDPELYRHVAIKTIRQDVNAAEYKRRFLREQRILARLHETRIIPIFESGTFEHAGRIELYYVMPLIEGAVALGDVLACARGIHTRGETPRLSDLIAKAHSGAEVTYTRNTALPVSEESFVPDIESAAAGTVANCSAEGRASTPIRHSPMYLRSVARVMSEVAVALDFGHSKGVIHRDCKPYNILVTPTEEVFVLDFGLASVVEKNAHAGAVPVPLLGENDLTQIFTQGTAGTPQYMAPEQFVGQADVRSDVWSLGVTLYELLTFQRPFGNDRTRVRQRIETEPPERVRDFAANIPKDLEAICLKALQKDPVRRYASAAEFASDLRRWQNGFPTRARPARAPRRVLLWARRNPGWAATMFVAIVASVVFFQVRVNQAETKRAESERESSLQKLQRIRLTSHRDGWSEEALRLGARAADIQRDDRVRDQIAASLAGVDVVKLHEWQLGGASASFSRQGDRLLLVGTSDGARIWNSEPDTFQAPLQTGPGPVAFNADDEGVAWAMETPWSFGLWNVSQRKQTASIKAPLPSSLEPPTDIDLMRLLSPRVAMAISSDASLVAASVPLPDDKGNWPDDRGATFVWNARGELLRQFDGGATTLCFSPDRTLLGMGRENGTIEVISLEDGTVLTALAQVENRINGLDFCIDPLHPDNARRWLLAAGDGGGTITVWDLAARQPRSFCRGSHYDVFVVKFSPDGMTLASGGRQAVRLWDYLTGNQLLEIRSAGDYHSDLSFSSDGRRLAVSAANFGTRPSVTVLAVEAGRGITQFHGVSSQVVKTVLSADSHWLAALGQKWEIGLFEVDPPRLRYILPAPRGFTADNCALAFSAGNKLLAVSSGSEARVFEIDTGALRHRWQLPPGLVDNLAFTPDNRLLSFRNECLDGKTPPMSNAPPERFPRVLRIRNLLGDDPLKPLAEITRFNWHVFHGVVHPQGSVFVADGLHRAGDGQAQEIIAFEGSTGAVLWQKDRRTIHKAPTMAVEPSGATLTFPVLRGEGAEFVNFTTGESRGQVQRCVLAYQNLDGYFATDGVEGAHSITRKGTQHPLMSLGVDYQPHQLSPCFSLDGRYLSIGTTDGVVVLCDLPQIERRLNRIGFPRWK